MKLLDMLTLGLLGSAAFLPALPAWADTPVPQATATPSEPAKPDPTKPEQSEDGQAKPDQTVARVDTRKAWLDDRKAFLAARLAGLRAGLQLTPEQEPLFKPVETALGDFADIRVSALGRVAAGRDRTAIGPQERLKRHSAHLIARGEAMAKLADATGPLLAALTAAQKDRLPVLLAGLGPRWVIHMAFATPDDRRGNEEGRGGRGTGDQGMGDQSMGNSPGMDGPRRHDHRFAQDRDRDRDFHDRDDGDDMRRRHHDREDRVDRDEQDDRRMDRDDRGGRRHHEDDDDDVHG